MDKDKNNQTSNSVSDVDARIDELASKLQSVTPDFETKEEVPEPPSPGLFQRLIRLVRKR